jgi:hypothetical protein
LAATSASISTSTSNALAASIPTFTTTSTSASTYSTSSTSSTSFTPGTFTSQPSPTYCHHDDTFRAIYFHLKTLPAGINIYQLKSEIIKNVQATHQNVVQQLKSIKHNEFPAYFETFSCFTLITTKNGSIIAGLKKYASFCHCVDKKNALPPSQPLSSANINACVQANLFWEVYNELKSAGSPLIIKNLKIQVTDRLKRLEQMDLLQQVTNMKTRHWRQYLTSFPNDFLIKSRMVELCKNTTPQHDHKGIASPTAEYHTSIADESDHTKNEPSTLPPTANLSNTVNDTIPSFMKKSDSHYVGLIENWEQCQQAVQYIQTYAIVAVDCEGIELSKTGKLCLVQIAVLSLEQYTFIFGIPDSPCLPLFSI